MVDELTFTNTRHSLRDTNSYYTSRAEGTLTDTGQYTPCLEGDRGKGGALVECP